MTDGGDGCDVVTDGCDGCGVVTDCVDGFSVVTDGDDEGFCVVTDGADADGVLKINLGIKDHGTHALFIEGVGGLFARWVGKI